MTRAPLCLMAYAYQVAHLMLLLVVVGKIQVVRGKIQSSGAIMKCTRSDTLADTLAEVLIKIIGKTQIQMAGPTVKAFITTTTTMQIVVVVREDRVIHPLILILVIWLLLQSARI